MQQVYLMKAAFLGGLVVGGLSITAAYLFIPSPTQALAECAYEADKLVLNAPPAKFYAFSLDKDSAQSAANSQRSSYLMADCMKARHFRFDRERANKNVQVQDETLHYDASYWHRDWRP